ncbi:hypothetical protein AVEN_116330-1 [Araneus ventricosus]|uniref:Uncharacterized protein n=1 Tax=Araneus ventricosus TaxID=182803 RepID=A0A4Y2E2C9_ARAVE|nr:hypothetical protein AVEN_116330-1 [Araneus ventricosus]
MTEAKTVVRPMDLSIRLKSSEKYDTEGLPYRELVGGLLYPETSQDRISPIQGGSPNLDHLDYLQGRVAEFGSESHHLDHLQGDAEFDHLSSFTGESPNPDPSPGIIYSGCPGAT